MKKVIFLALFLASSLLSFAQVDAFYLGALERGQEAYMQGLYDTAIEELEVAVFGLTSDSKLAARCFIFLSLSNFYIKDNMKSEEWLRKTEPHLDDQGFFGLDLADSILSQLENVWYQFNPSTSTFPGKPEPEEQPDTAFPVDDGALEERARALERQLRQYPQRVALYYQLYGVYSLMDDTREAEKTLERLLRNHHREIQAHFLLGKMDFDERAYKDAAKDFNRFVKAWTPANTEENVLIEAQAYLILCHNFNGKKDKAMELALEMSDQLTNEAIRQLPMTENDKYSLNEILRQARR